ncbi:hypothetical protein QR98_0081500 [Sarcoptes scabiei]|uniref:Uncharacterized protein n=1 Tax=Sarcoptes scabiei TaxID=52283 RepID=A0A132AF43_SARSC|nr:hypothetical protein QR98_0081500 [Sarcoptes scabiei]
MFGRFLIEFVFIHHHLEYGHSDDDDDDDDGDGHKDYIMMIKAALFSGAGGGSVEQCNGIRLYQISTL